MPQKKKNTKSPRKKIAAPQKNAVALPRRKAGIEHCHIPMDIQVGGEVFKLISLMYLYNECQGNTGYFDELASTAKESRKALGDCLLNHGEVLPKKCFEALYGLLNTNNLDAFGRKLIRERIPWQMIDTIKLPPDEKRAWKMLWAEWKAGGIVRSSLPLSCPWPDCPDEP